jgi:guanylate kinase
VTRDEFERAVTDGRFLEYEGRTMGNLYGTPFPEPGAGQDVVLEIDVAGAENIRNQMADALVILLVPPSREEQERRLRGRGDPVDAVEARLAAAVDEEVRGRAVADFVVVNDDLDRATGEVAALIEGRRQADLGANRLGG